VEFNWFASWQRMCGARPVAPNRAGAPATPPIAGTLVSRGALVRSRGVAAVTRDRLAEGFPSESDSRPRRTLHMGGGRNPVATDSLPLRAPQPSSCDESRARRSSHSRDLSADGAKSAVNSCPFLQVTAWPLRRSPARTRQRDRGPTPIACETLKCGVCTIVAFPPKRDDRALASPSGTRRTRPVKELVAPDNAQFGLFQRAQPEACSRRPRRDPGMRARSCMTPAKNLRADTAAC
jgi:hypothetical protein